MLSNNSDNTNVSSILSNSDRSFLTRRCRAIADTIISKRQAGGK
ncbi:hypothetical protein N0Y54_10365 [Nostoc punctiforme UO1]